jgi:hypothetical protein
MCREHNHLRRTAIPADEFVTAVILARLSQPDDADLLARQPDIDTAALAREVNALRARIDEAGNMWEAGELTRAEHRARTGRLREKLEAAEAALTDAAPRDPLAGLAGRPDAATVWAGLDIGRRRAIVDLLVTVTLLPARRLGRQPDGSYFDPDTVAITWKN